jgi:hypothetical protein
MSDQRESRETRRTGGAEPGLEAGVATDDLRRLLIAAGFAALAAVVLAATMIFGLPGAEQSGVVGRSRVTGRVQMTPTELRR